MKATGITYVLFENQLKIFVSCFKLLTDLISNYFSNSFSSRSSSNSIKTRIFIWYSRN